MAEKMTVEMATKIMREQGFHCSQCVMYHTAEALGMDKDTALKISSGLGAGCATGGICGAVSAGVMSLGLVYGFSQPNSKEQDNIMKAKSAEFKKKFLEKYPGFDCKDILGLNFSIPEQAQQIVAEGRTAGCPAICAYVCDILDEMLDELK